MPKPKATPPTSPTEPAIYTLDQLQSLLPAPDAADIAAAADETQRESFTGLGAKIASRHVVADATSICGLAYRFLTTAPAAARKKVDVSLELLAILVGRACDLRARTEKGAGSETEKANTRAELDRVARADFEAGLGERDRAESALLYVASVDHDARQKVHDESGNAADAEALASGLERQARLIRAWAKDAKSARGRRARLKGLDEARAASLEAHAKALRASAKAAGARDAGRVDQKETDFLDGVLLHMMEDVAHAFDRGHAIDGSIPTMPLRGTRHLIGHKQRHPKAAAAPAAGAAPPAPAG